MIRAGDYGPVRITVGLDKGKTGYYDDDEGTLAVVYLGELYESDYKVISRRHLERAEEHPALTAFARAHPGAVEQLGVVVKRAVLERVK